MNDPKVFIRDNNKIDTRLNAIEYVPTHDIRLKILNLDEFWKYVTKTYFSKILNYLYKYSIENHNIAFNDNNNYD